MSRSGYVYDMEQWDLIRWRGAVASATRGERGQRLLKDMAAALDAMPEKELISGELVEDGKVCALGALGQARGLDMSRIDPSEPGEVAASFGIARALACEIVYMNDKGEWRGRETPAERWRRVRAWVESQIREARP